MIYAEHPVVKKSDSLCRRIRPSLDKLGGSSLTGDQCDELSFNVEHIGKQLRKLKKSLKNDSVLVTTVQLDEIDDWIDITMSDAVLLKMMKLNDILDRKLDRIDNAATNRPRLRTLTREERLKAFDLKNITNVNKGF